MSFFSAEACRPRVADLAGLLCGPGRTAVFARATARLTVPVADPWRANALVRACAERGVRADVVLTPVSAPEPVAEQAPEPDEDPSDAVEDIAEEPEQDREVPPPSPLLRTAFRADLAPLAAAWGDDPVKSVPVGFVPDGAVLRMWVLAAGHWLDGTYLLPLDPAAPHTHEPLAESLARSGLPAVIHSTRRCAPALRLTGRRRLARLRELVGPPAGPGCDDQWPAVSRMRAVS